MAWLPVALTQLASASIIAENRKNAKLPTRRPLVNLAVMNLAVVNLAAPRFLSGATARNPYTPDIESDLVDRLHEDLHR